jgi:hypothetical protein
MPQWLQDLLLGIVSGSISGIIAAIAIAVGAAGIATGVWNPKKQLERIKDVVPRADFSRRWKYWLVYMENTTSHIESDTAEFQELVREINREFTSFPHPNFPPGSLSGVVAIDALPLLTRNEIVRGAIDKVRSKMSDVRHYHPLPMTELLSYLYWLIN